MSLPPKEIPLGAMRFNSDSQKLEYFNGFEWLQIHTFNPNLDGATRGIAWGGNNGSPFNDINYFTIETAGDAIDFGDMQGANTAGGACSDRTRSVYGGGQWPSIPTTHMQYITMAELNDAVDFGGNLAEGRDFTAAASNSTRGFWAGGRYPTPATGSTRIDYIEIQSNGVDADDFGDLRYSQLWYPMCLASPTKGIIGNSNQASPSAEIIDVITIANKGNASDFGQLSANKGGSGCSNSTRGIFAGGYKIESPYPLCNSITYITMATSGSSTDFGDLTRNNRGFGATSSSTRGVFSGGKEPGNSLTMDYITIASTGNAVDFGNLVGSARGNIASTSNGHGGLG